MTYVPASASAGMSLCALCALPLAADRVVAFQRVPDREKPGVPLDVEFLLAHWACIAALHDAK